MSNPVINLVAYHPKPGKEAELLAIVKKHWDILQKTGLVVGEPAKVWTARDLDREHRGPMPEYVLELFSWRDDKSSDVAHQTPEVMAVWETMGPILEKLTITKLASV
jgi:quinol monooxygenase YgiN